GARAGGVKRRSCGTEVPHPLPGGGEEERVLHRDLVRWLEGEDPAAHQPLDARGHLGAAERVLLDPNVTGPAGGSDVEAHHHLALPAGGPLPLSLLAAPDRPEAITGAAGPCRPGDRGRG